VGLIAHQLEEAGIATTSISTAKDITEAVRMPRSVFLDFPHGYTVGKVGDGNLSHNIVKSALNLVETADEEIMRMLPHAWEDNDNWKDSVFPVPNEASKAIDNRLERSQNPQYQTAEDKKRAKDTHEAKECDLCSGIDY
tara:strand:+ start:11079 stop:11495 length:417 start_codon:yes stop_codon:yes gene_type:complete